MYSINKVKLGQEWERPNGTRVIVNGERVSRGLRECLLTPKHKGQGRAAWKWECAITNELQLISDSRP